ncbi:MAG: pseudouridine-5'-phosphate glycosidase [Saprospiraceae bacterium]|nr:pseudouridine-5'-phosphate glycosidase [Saprospiraceae bacterium]
MHNFLGLSSEVQQAVSASQPIVALESTIISHGMPYPKNVETALRVEQTVRQSGAIPATCAVLDGRLRAGMSADEIERFGRAGTALTKASRRDLPYLVSQGQSGATTVAATMIIAAQAGIRVFATGGIGGVHRGATQTLDISADLQELAHTPVAVVSAGVKSILDIGLTLEYLETFGIPVLGYRCTEFPAFYTRKSGFRVDFSMESPEQIAQLLHAKWAMGLQGGVVVANPVPEAHQLDAQVMETSITRALEDAAAQGISGKALTPFLLARIEQLTGGDSLAANIELVCNNARLAAEIAAAMTRI